MGAWVGQGLDGCVVGCSVLIELPAQFNVELPLFTSLFMCECFRLLKRPLFALPCPVLSCICRHLRRLRGEIWTALAAEQGARIRQHARLPARVWLTTAPGTGREWSRR